MRTKKNVLISILLFTAIILIVNILSDKYFVRLDFTEDQRYTLSETTEEILESLSEPVTVTAYFSEDMPPDIAKAKRDFKEMLIEYANLSKGMLVYEFIDPSKDEKLEQAAYKEGIQPVVINVRDKNQVKQQKAYLGAVIKMGEGTEVIPFMQPGAAMEYSISSNIKKLSVIEKPSVGFVQGHGEPTIAAMEQVRATISVLYNLEQINLGGAPIDVNKYKTIAIVAPKDSFSIPELQQLDQYLGNGGRIFMALNRVSDKLQESKADPLNTGLESWLAQKGIVLKADLVLDATCGSVSVQQKQGLFAFNTQIAFPYLPIINKFPDHPITKGLETVLLPFVSSMEYTGDTSRVKMTPVLQTSTKSAVNSVPLFFNVQKQWQDADFPMQNVTVGAVYSGKLSGEVNSKLVLFGDGDFAINGEGQGAMQRQADNISLMANAIDWLSDDTGLIDLRTKGVSSHPLDQLEDGTKTLLKYFNFALPILLVIIYGIIRMQIKRNIKIKRMEGDYV